ncbi:MAG: TonB-dependent receptor, partial [Sphingomonas sp. 28-66-16]
MRPLALAVVFLAGASPAAVAAQQQKPPAPAPSPAPVSPPIDEADDGGDIIVRGTRVQPGAVIGDIPPDQQLGPAEIRSYGVSSVTDLLAELAPQTRSGRGGAPVVLLNGRRISSFSEIRNLPTEAILRVDILPEEVSLKYGYSADQRVVNFVLRPRFRAITTELQARAATEGGRATPQGELDVLKITRQGRINVHLEYQESSALTEVERGIVATPTAFSAAGNIVGVGGGEIDPALSAQAGALTTIAAVPASAATRVPTLTEVAAGAGAPSVTDPTPYRTLLPAARTFSANGIFATTILDDVGATFNARLETTDARSSFGLPTVALALPAGNPFSPFGRDVVVDRALDQFRPLGQQSQTLAAHLGATFNGTVGGWQWSLIANFDRTDSRTLTDTGVDSADFQARLRAGDRSANPFGVLGAGQIGAAPSARASSTATTYGIDTLVNGTLFALPAGPVAASFRFGGQSIGFDTETLRAGIFQQAQLARGIANGQLNLDVPITSRSKDFLGAVGNLSANFNLAYDHLSDFGTLRTLGYGVNWSPIEAVRLIGSVTEQDGAPTPQQLGNPVITTLNVRVFDYTRGENANVTTLSGGNPGLVANFRLVKRLGLTVKPFAKTDVNLTASYTDTRVDNAIANFPPATAAIEAAFPDRFTRDASGQLLRIDTRSVNFGQTRRSELRYGINFSVPIKSQIQKQIEAFRAGTGPNPFQGLAAVARQGSVFGGPAFPGRAGQGGDPSQRRNGRASPDAGPPPPAADGQSAAAPGATPDAGQA